MLRNTLLILFVVLASVVDAQFVRTASPSVRSPRMELNGEWGSLPVMTLGSDDVMCFSFDEMSHAYRRFIYRITHCNADWEPSGLSEIEYLDGFNGMPVEEWENSVNTIQLYTRYSFSIPNEDVSLLLSGNYKVEVYDDEDGSAPLLVFAFPVVEPRVSVDVSVSGNTDISFNDGRQQISFTVNHDGYDIASPAAEIIPVVYQNRRLDNAVHGVRPTYVTAGALEYVHNDRLIFDAGNEYRRFELTDPRAAGMGVEEILCFGDEYHALLYVDKRRSTHSSYKDENGRYFVNTHEGYGSQMEADYVYVHFALADIPWLEGGDFYILGDLCGNGLDLLGKLDYDVDEGYYYTTLLLKLGLYNYMYVWVPSDSGAAVTHHAEGDFYNTENEYLVYIYHREFGARYDRLVGVGSVNYRLEDN